MTVRELILRLQATNLDAKVGIRDGETEGADPVTSVVIEDSWQYGDEEKVVVIE